MNKTIKVDEYIHHMFLEEREKYPKKKIESFIHYVFLQDGCVKVDLFIIIAMCVVATTTISIYLIY